MNKIVQELKKAGVFYVATIDSNQARVRPFSSICEFEGKAYICTNNKKECYKQMIENPNIEICAMQKDGSWIRITTKLVRDDRDEARNAMLSDPTGPSNLYKLGDNIFEVLYFDNPVCVKYSFTSKPIIIEQ